jgi:hypothetical protein
MTKETVDSLLNKAKFKFAKSMARIPHSYSLRAGWDDAEFVEVVKYMREHGEKEMFYSKMYIYYYANGYKYWTMGCPLHNDAKTGTILINRAIHENIL